MVDKIKIKNLSAQNLKRNVSEQLLPLPAELIVAETYNEKIDEQLLNLPVESIVVGAHSEKIEHHKEIDLGGLIKDLMFNRYFCITKLEARRIAERMVSKGSAALNDVKWFLTHVERVQLAKELKEKYNLL